MGTGQYGDCIVCRRSDRSILIDGGRPGDETDNQGAETIPDQLAEIFGHPAPFAFDLLVVTHVHVDHTGCLPAMVKKGIVTAKHALVADVDLAYGRVKGAEKFSLAGLTAAELAALAAVREEAAFEGLSDVAAESLIAKAAGQEGRYGDMIDTLKNAGTKVEPFVGQDLSRLEQTFADFEIKFLGPTANHLEICARAIANGLKKNSDLLKEWPALVKETDPVAIFRMLTQSEELGLLADKSRPGNALNNQSIVISLGSGNGRVLLTGDMQFAEPDLGAVDAEMERLRAAIRARGPYAFAKVAHHGSGNAFNPSVIDDVGAKYLGISGGEHGADHPSSSVLKLLREKEKELKWARTDKNGCIHARITEAGVEVKIAKGKLNDSTPNP